MKKKCLEMMSSDLCQARRIWSCRWAAGMKEGVVKSTNVALSWQAVFCIGANVNVLDQMVNSILISDFFDFVVVDLLYWRDIKKTGVVFGASLFLLLSLTVFSIVSVTAYIALALLSVTISFRIYKGVIQAIQKSDEGHPFRWDV